MFMQYSNKSDGKSYMELEGQITSAPRLYTQVEKTTRDAKNEDDFP